MHYTPILKDKPAELKALTLLGQPRPTAIEHLWPMIEVLVPDDEAEIKDDLDKVNRALSASQCRRFMVDLNAVDAAYPAAKIVDLPSTYSPLAYLGVVSVGTWQLTPVVNLASTPAYLGDAAAEAARHGAGVAIRIIFEDFEDPAFEPNLDALLVTLGMPKSDVHIIIDAASIPPANLSALSMALIGAISGFPHLSDWASITVSGSGFPPASPADPPGAGSIARIPRTEWQLYNRLLKRFPDLDLNFGDYGVDHPEFAPNPNARAVSNLRYTTHDEWLFVKGRLMHKGGADFFRDVCRIMAAQPEYMTPTYSWGDEFIDICGGGGGGTGNAGTWRQVAVTHHITFVLEQLTRSAAGAAATTPAF